MEKVLNRILVNRKVSLVSIFRCLLIQLGEERQWTNFDFKCPSKRTFVCQVDYFARKLSVYLPLTEFGDNYNFILLKELLKLLKVPYNSWLKL